MGKNNDTIAAIATPPGRGGVGIVRVSGPNTQFIAQQILGCVPKPRYCEYHSFKDNDNQTIDMGLAVFFPNPHSFTGEDVLEFHGHGGPVILNYLMRTILALGARIAKPGEFSERAFLNGKIDLTQAEAIADLIDSASEQAAKCAIRSLQGDFSNHVHRIVERVIHLRMFIEASIDFPDEEIDFLADEKIPKEISVILDDLENVNQIAKQGILLREGMQIVIAGRPNAGKSSLLNCLSGRESAIVTNIPGTTRDLLRENILIDGIPLHIIDTAGLRQSNDEVEREGVRRAVQEIDKADRILLVVDAQSSYVDILKEYDLPEKTITIVRNKIDMTGEKPSISYENNRCIISISAKQQRGIELLRNHLKECVGAQATEEGGFIARQRHLDALKRAKNYIEEGQEQFIRTHAGELLAEDLRLTQEALNEITGEFTSDDLLGVIFSKFCIGK